MGGESNWHNTAFILDALKTIQPERVLDLGVGSGRWGMVIREFGPQDAPIRLEGAQWPGCGEISEAFRYFYDRLIQGEHRMIRAEVAGPWDAVILDVSLCGQTRTVARSLLQWAYENAAYVLANLPLGAAEEDEAMVDASPLTWREEDLGPYQVLARVYQLNPDGSVQASLLISRQDPLSLSADHLLPVTLKDFEEWSPGRADADFAHLVAEEGQVLERLRRDKENLINIRWTYSYRLIQGMKKVPPVRWAERGAQKLVFEPINALGSTLRTRRQAARQPWDHVWLENTSPAPEAGSVGNLAGEVCLLALERDQWSYLPDDEIQREGNWELESDPASPSGKRLISHQSGTASVRVRPGDRLVFLAHPAGGRVKLTRRGQLTEADLAADEPGLAVYDCGTLQVTSRPLPAAAQENSGPAIPLPEPPRLPGGDGFSPNERVWIERMLNQPRPVSVANPSWRGIYSSTEELFDEIYDVPDLLTPAEADHHALVLKEAGLKQVVIQGFPLAYQALVKSLHRLAPEMKIYILWHGSFLQAMEEYAWKSFKVVLELWRDGLVHKLGFVKKGMAEAMASEGRPTGFVMNLVRRIPTGPSQPLEGGPHLGNWNLKSSWRKPVFGMLMASRMIPGAVVHTTGAMGRELNFIKVMNLDCRATTDVLTKSALLREMSRMHLNLYVTLSECAPMVPLESLSVGSPCIFGPNSHYFEDHPELHRHLVVPYPDSTTCIVQWAQAAIENRDEIIRLYMEYAPGYNQRAQESLQKFLAD